MNFLTDSERQQLKIQHRGERDGRVRDRIKAILLYDEGWSPKEIAKVLLISDESIRQHVDEYKASKKLCPESGGSKEKLSKTQSERLEAHLQEHTYLLSQGHCGICSRVFWSHLHHSRTEELAAKTWFLL